MKDIPGLESRYAALEDGRIWSHRRGKFLKLGKDKIGYLTCCIFNNRRKCTKTVHRLVAITHIPNPENKRTVNHKNWIKDDNRIENLEWMTYSENHLHAFNTLGRKISDKHRASAIKNCVENKSKPVMQLTKEGILCRIYRSASEAARITWFSQTWISQSARGEDRKRRGYLRWYFWKYV